MGLDDPSKDSRYKELGEFFRMQKDVARHNEWRGVYEEAFRLEHKKAIEEQHKTPHQAKRYARTKAEYAVVKEFSKKVTTTRAVRNAMKPFGEVDIE